VPTPPKLLALALASGLLSSLVACNSTPPGADAGYLSWSPPGLWLTAPAGGQTDGIVTLTNGGSQTDAVSSIAVANATRPVFTVSTSSLVVDIDAGIGVTVVYAPPSCLDGGDDLADIDFTTDSSDSPSYTLQVVGICTPALAADAGEIDGGMDAGVDAGDAG
jgi:hypothetical protein